MKLNLSKKKKQNSIIRRYEKVKNYFPDSGSMLEIGQGDGNFLKFIKKKYPRIDIAAYDKDKSSTARVKNSLDIKINDLNDGIIKGYKFDIICLFHVFEHIYDPNIFLSQIKQLMHSNSFIIIEVPSLFDPLISIYNCQDYIEFYFQSQHPFIYSHSSLNKVLSFSGFCLDSIISYQRYGLDNHLQWMSNGCPGGNSDYEKLIHPIADNYISILESSDKTDTVIWVGKPTNND